MDIRFYFVLLLVSLCIGVVYGKIYVENGGISNLVISIDKDVNESAILLDKIKEYFQDASIALFAATGNRTYFKEVTISIPPSWNVSIPNLTQTHVKHADVIVMRGNPLFGDSPYVKQTGDCGDPGEYMHLTPGYLLSNLTQRYGPYGKTIAHEFAHYKWGVFDEYTLNPSEIQYYNDSQNNHKPNTCADNMVGNWIIPGRNEKCDPRDQSKRCLFKPLEKNGTNEEVASLMGFHFLKQVTKFCQHVSNATTPNHVHNDLANTPQNRRCDRRSVMEVIWSKHSEDLSEAELSAENITGVTFNIVQQPNKSRYLFIVEPIVVEKFIHRDNAHNFSQGQGHMGRNLKRSNQISRLTKSFNNFMDHLSEPKNTIITIQYTSGGNFTEPEIGTTAKTTLRNKFQEALTASTETGVVPCKNITDIIGEAANKSVTHVYLYSYGGPPKTTDAECNFTAPSENTPIPFKFSFIQLGDKNISSNLSIMLEEISERSGGKYFDAWDVKPVIREERLEIPGRINKNKKIQIAISHMPNSKHLKRSFLLEEDLNEDVQLSIETLEDIAFNLTWTSPSGINWTVLSSALSKFNFTENGPFQWTVPLPNKTETGRWNYSITTMDENDMTASISAKPSGDVDPVVVTARLNSNKLDFDASSLDEKVMIITGEVKKGFFPVLEAVVKGVITGESLTEDIIVDLYDNGIGADKIPSDGIYTGYVTGIYGSGGLSVSVKVDNTMGVAKTRKNGNGLAGSAYDNLLLYEQYTPEPPPEPTISFERYEEAGDVQLINFPPNATDIYPPARVVDLLVVGLDHGLRVATLQFTSTGDDMMSGTAQRYQIRHAPSTQQLRDAFYNASQVETQHFRKPDRQNPVPQQAGTQEVFDIHFPENEKPQSIYSVALVVIDDEKQHSEVSNMATFTFNAVSVPSTTPGIQSITTTTLNDSSISSTQVPGNSLGLEKSVIMIIAISTAVLVFLIIVIVVLSCCFGNCCRKKSDYNRDIHIHFNESETASYPSPPPYSAKQTDYAPGRGMRSTVRRELEEIETLPCAPAPPPPAPRKRLLRTKWDEMKGTVKDSRFGKSVKGAKDRIVSRFYRGHISYRDHNGMQRAEITVHIEPEQQLDDNPPRYPDAMVSSNHAQYGIKQKTPKKTNFNSKASGKYAASITPSGSECSDADSVGKVPWNKQSGKYAPTIDRSSEEDANCMKNMRWNKQSGKYEKSIAQTYDDPVVFSSSNLEQTDLFHQDSINNINTGMINPAFLMDSTEELELTRDRPSSTDSNEIYSHVPRTIIGLIPSDEVSTYVNAPSKVNKHPHAPPPEFNLSREHCEQVVTTAFDYALEGFENDPRKSGIYEKKIHSDPYQKSPPPVKRLRDRSRGEPGDNDVRISRSSFYDDIDKEQGGGIQSPNFDQLTNEMDSTLLKAGAKRIGFNYLAPKEMK